MPASWSVATVRQETPSLEKSALDYVMDGDKEFRQLEQELTKARVDDNGNRPEHLRTVTHKDSEGRDVTVEIPTMELMDFRRLAIYLVV